MYLYEYEIQVIHLFTQRIGPPRMSIRIHLLQNTC